MDYFRGKSDLILGRMFRHYKMRFSESTVACAGIVQIMLFGRNVLVEYRS
jgi:hypothetical protein